jgi:hypothetical protein
MSCGKEAFLESHSLRQFLCNLRRGENVGHPWLAATITSVTFGMRTRAPILINTAVAVSAIFCTFAVVAASAGLGTFPAGLVAGPPK